MRVGKQVRGEERTSFVLALADEEAMVGGALLAHHFVVAILPAASRPLVV